MPKPWTFRRWLIADALWAAWYGLGLIYCSVCEEFRNSKHKLTSLAGEDEGSARVPQRRAETHCMHVRTQVNVKSTVASHEFYFQGWTTFTFKHKATRTFLKIANTFLLCQIDNKTFVSSSSQTRAKDAYLQCCCLPPTCSVCDP